MATLIQAYVGIKLALLGLFLAACFVDIVRGLKVRVYPRLTFFYLAICILGSAWALRGLNTPGNYVTGVTDGVRLYVVWSLAYLLLYTLLRSYGSLKLIHAALVLSGFMICALNFAALADQLSGAGAFPESVREALDLRIGIHEGYVQITSRNIGSLFVIVPYLVALQFRRDAPDLNNWVTKLCTVSVVALAVLSGRRALWIVVALTPVLVVGMAHLAQCRDLLKRGARRAVVLYALCVAAVMVVPSAGPEILRSASVAHLTSAFSAEDERTIQRGYLVDGFLDSPIAGVGFGAYAGYKRNDLRPWTYELTYFQMLFNLGVLGVVALGGLIAGYSILVRQVLVVHREDSVIPFGLTLGFFTLLIGAYSNPYLGSFDLLFFVGTLPFLATFTQGFRTHDLRPEAVR